MPQTLKSASNRRIIVDGYEKKTLDFYNRSIEGFVQIFSHARSVKPINIDNRIYSLDFGRVFIVDGCRGEVIDSDGGQPILTGYLEAAIRMTTLA